MAGLKRIFALLLFSGLASTVFYFMFKGDSLDGKRLSRWWVKADEEGTGVVVEEEDPEFLQFCPKLEVSEEIFSENAGVTCKRHKSTVAACKYATRVFSNALPEKKCRGIPYREICNVEFAIHNKVSISCAENVCNSDISLLSLNPNSGHLERMQHFDSAKKLEKDLPHIIQNNLAQGVKFAMISCHANGADIKQMLEFPVVTKGNTPVDKKKYVNVNVMLLDSVSRPHFYRSLPQTVDFFKRINRADSAFKGKVYDFELFQAVKGRTYETVHALFTGELLPITNPFAPNPKPVGIDVMFQKFKDNGYYTMYQEDLCWKESWGIMYDLQINQYPVLMKKLRQIAVDEMGITHSSCEILRDNGVGQPFQGPPEICLNGKYQAEYYLEYILNMLHSARKTSRPLLSYCALNVGHESSAKRIQTLDSVLPEFMNMLLTEHKDTITILLADHGNTYSRFTEEVNEGQFEIFNPILFMVVPDQVAAQLGPQKMQALQLNQKRLGNVIDLHHMLMSLADLNGAEGKKLGFAEKIKANRTCDDLEMLQPNLCVCEGWDLPVNGEFKGAHAEFAVGMLNNMIQDQISARKSTAQNPHGHCQCLKPQAFQNIRSRRQRGGRVVISMDLVVPAGDAVKQETDKFHVEVSGQHEPGKKSMDMKLETFLRLSGYQGYKVCADPRVSLPLCICSNKRVEDRVAWPDTVFGRDTVEHKIYKDCLVLLRRTILNRNNGIDSAGIEVANRCKQETFNITVDVNVENMKTSTASPVSLTLQPGTTKFVASAVKTVWYRGIMLNCQVTVKTDGQSIFKSPKIKF